MLGVFENLRVALLGFSPEDEETMGRILAQNKGEVTQQLSSATHVVSSGSSTALPVPPPSPVSPSQKMTECGALRLSNHPKTLAVNLNKEGKHAEEVLHLRKQRSLSCSSHLPSGVGLLVRKRRPRGREEATRQTARKRGKSGRGESSHFRKARAPVGARLRQAGWV